MNTDETTCPDCAETIKAAAKVCKHCGWRRSEDAASGADQPTIRQASTSEWQKPPSGITRHPERLSAKTIAITIVCTPFVLAALWFVAVRESNIRNMIDPIKQGRAEQYITRLLRDPSSVQFRNVHTNGTCVTGEVNMRNGLGGYVGFRDFFYNDKFGVGLIEPDPLTVNVDDAGMITAASKQEEYTSQKIACVS